jgi:hypothetical protein
MDQLDIVLAEPTIGRRIAKQLPSDIGGVTGAGLTGRKPGFGFVV